MPRTQDVLDHPVTRAVTGTALLGGVVIAVAVSLSALVGPLPATDVAEPVVIDEAPGLPSDEEPAGGWPTVESGGPAAPAPATPAATNGDPAQEPDAGASTADPGTDEDPTLLDETVDDLTDTVEDTVDDATDTVEDTVDDATDTVDDLLDDVGDTVDDTTGDVLP